MVKTADDRLAIVWSEYVKDSDCSDSELETVIVNSLKHHGRHFESVFQDITQNQQTNQNEIIFSD